jgi:hypothetical protein
MELTFRYARNFQSNLWHHWIDLDE